MSSRPPQNSKKSPEDCRFFMADSLSCRKEFECRYRHCAAAQSQERICREWQMGVCNNMLCGFRHPGKSAAPQSSECSICYSSVCDCGYGKPSTLGFLEQQPAEQALMHNQVHLDAYGATFQSVSRLNVRGRGVSNVSLSEDGTFLATYGKQRGASASLWSTADRLTEEFSFGKSSAFKNFSAFNVKFGGQFLAASTQENSIFIWDMNHPPRPSLLQLNTTVLAMDAAANKLCCLDGSGVKFWKVKRDQIKSVGSVNMDIGNSSAKIKFLGGRTKLIAAAVGNKIFLVDVRRQLITGILEGHRHPVLSLAWNENDGLLSSVSKEVIKVWELSENTISDLSIAELSSTTSNAFTCAVFHPSIPRLIVLGLEKSMAIWKLGSESLTTIGVGKVQSLAAAGNIIASCQEDGIKVWRI